MVNVSRMSKKKLGEILLQADLITQEQVEEALVEQSQTGELTGEILVRKGYVSEENIAETIAKQFSLPYISTEKYYSPPEVIDLLPVPFMQKNQIVPLDRFGNTLTIAVAGAFDDEILRKVEEMTSCQIQVYVSTISDVRTAIERYLESKKKSSRQAVETQW